MDTLQLQASTQYIENALDGRKLTLSLNYYQCSKEKVSYLSETLFHWIQEISSHNIILQWVCNGMDVQQKQLGRQLASFSDEQLRITFNGFVISPIINDLRTLKRYQRRIQNIHPVYTFGWNVNPFCGKASIDFPEYFDDKFPLKRPCNDDIIQSVYGVFCESDKVYKTFHNHSDLEGSFHCSPYQSHPNLYYGHAHISFSAFCLGDFINNMADNLTQLAQQVSEKLVTLNAHIRLQPSHTKESPYMHYFGKNCVFDGSHNQLGYSSKEWYQTYYLCGVEWANILSPLTSNHLKSTMQTITQECDVIIRKLNHGGIIVKSPKNVTAFSISDALALKSILWPALFPGYTSVPLRGIFPRQNEPRIYEWCPRYDWAIIPIEKQEIEIIGSDLVYISKGAKNNLDTIR